MSDVQMAERIQLWPTSKLVPYVRNPRTHSDEQVRQIAKSMQEFGFTNPILVDSDAGIIAGHGRLKAAQLLNLSQVPVICLDHLTEDQKRAYVIADNRLAEQSGWDYDLLTFELRELQQANFDMDAIGFSDEELLAIDLGLEPADEEQEDGEPGAYTQKVVTPIYEPSDQCPDVADLWDRSKADRLQAQIRQAKLPSELQQFLLDAAERFVVFRFDRIADYYAHTTRPVQDLIEESALVLIDFDKAIENGFVQLNADVEAAFAEDHPDAG
jgi:ParB-like chromosome segregation protein Spo0J